MIIEEQNPTPPKPQTAEKEYNAYEEAHESKDMAIRGHRDRVKFSNKRSRQDAEDFDVEMTDAYAEEGKTPPTKKKTVIFGDQKKIFQKRRPIHH